VRPFPRLILTFTKQSSRSLSTAASSITACFFPGTSDSGNSACRVWSMRARTENMLASTRAMAGIFLCGFLLFGIGVYSFTQFLEPLRHEFGWDRATLGALMSAFWIAAPFAVLAAYLLPRLGVRRLVLIGGAIEALSLAAMVGASHKWQFIALRFLMGAGKVTIATPLPIMAALWFTKRPGMAIAISLCGWHTGGLVMAPLSALLIATLGWREAAIVLSLVLLSGMLLAAFLLRAPPVARIDDADESQSSALKRMHRSASPISLMVIGLGTIAFYLGYAGMLAQLSPLLADCGFDAAAIASLMGSLAACAAIGVLVAGAFTQILTSRLAGSIILLAMAITAVGAVAMGPTSPKALPITVVIMLGLLVGGGDPILIDALRQVVPSHYFDRAYGWWYLVCLAALGIGPYFAGLVFDVTRSYRGAFLSIGFSCLIVFVLWLVVLRRPDAPRSFE
jgi:MFS transporter, OFA family, oxalate/formate antiporter